MTLTETNRTVGRLVLVPSAITLGVTLVRLAGELLLGPPILFGRTAGGGAAIVGISWLPILFGPYFALCLARSEPARPSRGRLWAYTGLGLLPIAALIVISRLIKPQPMVQVLLGWTASIVMAAIVYQGWPMLGRVLLAYGFAARVPVALVMLVAMLGRLGTHYDALAPGLPSMGVFLDWLVIGLGHQLFAWIPYTTFVGALFAAIALSVAKAPRPA